MFALVAALIFQRYVTSNETTFLAQPIPLSSGGRLIAFELDRRDVAPGEIVHARLYLEGGQGPVPLVLTPVSFDPDFERRPDLDRRTLDVERLRPVSAQVEIPRSLTKGRPGAYGLRVRGRAPVFGNLTVGERR